MICGTTNEVALVFLGGMTAGTDSENSIFNGCMLKAADAQRLLVMHKFHVGNLSRRSKTTKVELK